jgi:hypothetical protein
MIASVFNKSKPINFVIVFFILVLAFTAANVSFFTSAFSLVSFLEKTTIFLTCYFSVLLLNFIVVKNNLSKNNHFQILLFALFFLLFPESTINVNFLVSNIFIMFGLRRILSLRSQIRIKKKIFDAAFWFGLAMLFYFWSGLYFILVFSSLLLYTDNRIKNWLIPFASITSIFIISISLSVVLYDDFLKIFNFSTAHSYDYSIYNTSRFLIAITLLLSFGIWASIFYGRLVQHKKKAFRPAFKIIFISVLIAFVMVIIAPKKDGSEFIFLFAPSAIIMANYIESVKENWFKELFLSVLVVVPLILLML